MHSSVLVVLWEASGGRKGKLKGRSGGGKAIARPRRGHVKALQDPYIVQTETLKQPKCFRFCFCQTAADQETVW